MMFLRMTLTNPLRMLILEDDGLENDLDESLEDDDLENDLDESL